MQKVGPEIDPKGKKNSYRLIHRYYVSFIVYLYSFHILTFTKSVQSLEALSPRNGFDDSVVSPSVLSQVPRKGDR